MRISDWSSDLCSSDLIPFARIRIGDGDASLEDFPLSNQEQLIPGNEIEIRIGYRSDNTNLFRGIIVTHSNRITAGRTELVIECRDQAVKMTLGRKNKHFEEVTNADIAEEIIGRYGIEREIESSAYQYREAVQFNTTRSEEHTSELQSLKRISF